MSLKLAKRISDTIHGSVGLTDLEIRTIDTKVFQRLRNVKQLGMVDRVFPGASYSRFSHAIGTCHVTGRILDAIESNTGTKLDSKEIQLYRLAGLLHDIGHYPFSHATEHAISKHYANNLMNSVSETNRDSTLSHSNGSTYYPHEHVGKEVLRCDKEISTIIKEFGFSPEEIADIFTRANPLQFANLVSSDLDADRIDYLLRTARHSGLPYGSVDIDYILSQMTLDNSAQRRVCLTEKAVRAAEHLLLCRYYDYRQIVFNKTVVGLEWLLKDVIKGLLAEGRLDISPKWVENAIKNDEWCKFDDSYIVKVIRDRFAEDSSDLLGFKASAVLDRNPPSMVWERDIIGQRSPSDLSKSHNMYQTILEAQIKDWADEFGIPRERWYIWNYKMPITKIGSHVPIEEPSNENIAGLDDQRAQEIRVRNYDGSSSIIVNSNGSLLRILSDQSLYITRVYVLLSASNNDMRKEIGDRIADTMAQSEGE